MILLIVENCVFYHICRNRHNRFGGQFGNFTKHSTMYQHYNFDKMHHKSMTTHLKLLK